MDKNKVIVSVQIDQALLNALKEKANYECASVSYLIRRGILRELREGEKDGR